MCSIRDILQGKVYVHVMLDDLLAMRFCDVIASFTPGLWGLMSRKVSGGRIRKSCRPEMSSHLRDMSYDSIPSH